MAKAQVVICKCGSKFAACVEPNCYTQKEWLKDLRKYVQEGCTVEMIEATEFKFERCKCEKEKIDVNQTELFSLEEVKGGKEQIPNTP